MFGDKTIIKKLSTHDEQFYIVPRKFSVEGMNTVTPLMTQFKSNAEVEGSVSIPNDLDSITKLYRAFFRFGIGRHNLTDDGRESSDVTEQTIDFICESMDLALEVFTIVKEFQSFFTSAKTSKSK